MGSPDTNRERRLAQHVLRQLEDKGLLDRELVSALLAETVQWLLNHDPKLQEQLREILRHYQEASEDVDSGPVN